jgi:hypothetical protein
MIQPMIRADSYNGNNNVKREGVVTEFTEHQVSEYTKCMKDPSYFACTYLKVIHLDHGLVPFGLYDYQAKMFDHFNASRFSVVLSVRQSGKSISSCAYLLWYAVFHSEKTIAILANKGATSREMLSRITLMLENLPFFLQPGCKTLNKGSIEFDNNSRIIAAATSGSSIRGMSCVPDYTKVTIETNGEIYHTEISKCINNKSEFIEIKNKMKKYYTVYKIRNSINSKEYIGFHSTNDLKDGYMGSGKLIKKAIEKYGIGAFDKEYLAIFDNKESAEALEKELVNLEYVMGENTYNLSIGGNVTILYGELNGFYGRKHTKETKSLISKANTGYVHTSEAKQKISESSKLKWLNEDYRKKITDGLKSYWANLSEDSKIAHNSKISVSLTNVNKSEEHKKNLSISKIKFHVNMNQSEKDDFYKMVWTDEHKSKISESLKGKTKTKDHIDKINKNPEKIRKTAEKHRGMTRSDETKALMSNAAKGRVAKNKGKIYCYNPETLEKMLCYIEAIPSGWTRGFVPK